MIIDFFGVSSRSPEERMKMISSFSLRKMNIPKNYMNFGQDYFDTENLGIGYGGYRYDGRFARDAKRIIDHYGLQKGDRVLELGCAKGFLLVEFFKLGMEVAGIDISEYAVQNAHPLIRQHIQRRDACDLPFSDKSFDLVISKEMLPHIPASRLSSAIRECSRVSKGNIFFEIQCGRKAKDVSMMRRWDATHKVMKMPKWWNAFLARCGYSGDMHYKFLF